MQHIQTGICQSDHLVGRHFTIVILTVVCVLAIFGNTMVVIAFIRNKSLRVFGNFFLLSLAVSDFITGIWIFPNTIYNLVNCASWMSTLLCNLSGYIDNVILTNSVATLSICSYDRYLLITNPLFYKRFMTRRRALGLLAVTWVYSCVLSLPPFFQIGYYRLSTYSGTCALTVYDATDEHEIREFTVYFTFYVILTFIPPLSLMIYCYFRIFQTAKKISESEVSRHSTRIGSGSVSSSVFRSPIRNVKAALMIAVIIGVYMIFVMPVSIIGLLHIVFEVTDIPKDAALVATYLVLCNAFCNPIIYGIMNKDFRKTFKNILFCRSDRKSRQLNYRRESLAYSLSGGHGTTLLRNRPSLNSIFSNDVSMNSLFSIATDLKRYFERQNTSTLSVAEGGESEDLMGRGGKQGSGGDKAEGGSTIAELSENSTCSKSNAVNTSSSRDRTTVTRHGSHVTKQATETSIKKTHHISNYNPFRFIWNIKSASYECVRTFSKYRRKTSTL